MRDRGHSSGNQLSDVHVLVIEPNIWLSHLRSQRKQYHKKVDLVPNLTHFQHFSKCVAKML